MMSAEITTWVEKSRNAVLRAGNENLEATAYTYLVFRASWGPDADQAARNELKTAIDNSIAGIKIENGRLETLRDRGVRLVAKKVIADEVFNALPELHRDKKDARHLAGLKLAAFKKLQGVALPYDEKNPDEVLSAIVRHSTGFYRSSQRFSVSLYKKAVEWLDDEFVKMPRDKLIVDDLVMALNDAGGFADVVAKQRSKTPRKPPKKPPVVPPPPPNAPKSDVDDAAKHGFVTGILNVTLKLPEHLKELPEGRLMLEIISDNGMLTVVSCTEKPEPKPSANELLKAPTLQPQQLPLAALKTEPVPAT